MILVCEEIKSPFTDHNTNLNILTLKLLKRALKIVGLFRLEQCAPQPHATWRLIEPVVSNAPLTARRIGKNPIFPVVPGTNSAQVYKLTNQLLDVSRNARTLPPG